MSLKFYGHYVSQPARSVLWLLKLNKKPFEFVKVEPLAGGSRTPEFLSKFPLGHVPTIDDDGFLLAESTAILQYLCERNSWDAWWSLNPSEVQTRAKISEYLSFHHCQTRKISGLAARPFFLEKYSKVSVSTEQKQEAKIKVNAVLEEFERCFLKPNLYINGLHHPTIADLSAYTEIAQLEQLNLMRLDADRFPLICQWLLRMSQVPEHDDVHATVKKLGNTIKTTFIE